MSLFVKKRNAAAQAAYARVGFARLGESRISCCEVGRTDKRLTPAASMW